MASIGLSFCRLSSRTQLFRLQQPVRYFRSSTCHLEDGARYFLKLKENHNNASAADLPGMVEKRDEVPSIPKAFNVETIGPFKPDETRIGPRTLETWNEVSNADSSNRRSGQVSVDEITELDPVAEELPGPLTDTLNEDIDLVAPAVVPTFNFAAYINDSETLKELIKLGVDLHQVEKHRHREIPSLILNLNFDKDVKPIIEFYNNLGVPIEELGSIFTKNPKLLTESPNSLQVRINYLKSKKFSDKAIARIVQKAPYWLTFQVREVDRRLGIIQRMFSLSGNEIRNVVLQCPKLVTLPIDKVQMISFSVKEEMGFTTEEMKEMLLKRPKLWLSSRLIMMSRFDYLHNTMGITHEQILQFPDILRTRKLIIQQRHMFLSQLGRVQYDPEKPRYISLKELVACADGEFCLKIAKTSVNEFNDFLKTH